MVPCMRSPLIQRCSLARNGSISTGWSMRYIKDAYTHMHIHIHTQQSVMLKCVMKSCFVPMQALGEEVKAMHGLVIK